MNKIVLAGSTNPYVNLAVEEYLMDRFDGRSVMYLWQNADTIVIGRTQNAYRECRVKEFEEDGGFLARRSTGGGAVYHDLGNLNFSFICPREEYDLAKNLKVILGAVRSFGIGADFSGRNDILAEGKKFSGNAFRHTGRASLHHGTILFDADMTKLSRYLQPSARKMESKGVKSVQSRVINLRELNPEIDAEKLKRALIKSYIVVFGESEVLSANELIPHGELEPYVKKYSSWEWRLGENPQFNTEKSARYSFGEITYMLDVKACRIERASVYSDALNSDFIEALKAALEGVRYEKNALEKAVSSLNFEEKSEIISKIDLLFE